MSEREFEEIMRKAPHIKPETGKPKKKPKPRAPKKRR